MTTEDALLLLVAILTVGALVLLAVTVQRLSGSVKLELDLGGREVERARMYASALRDVTGASQGPQPLRTSDVTVTPPVTPQIVVEQETGARIAATLYEGGREVQQHSNQDPGTGPAIPPTVTR